MSDLLLEKPPLRIQLGEGEDTIDIKMTYGLELDLRRMLPNAQAAVTLSMNDSVTQDFIVRRCLTPLATSIRDEAQLIAADLVMLPSDDIQRLLTWAVDHVLYFFVKRAKSMEELGARYQTLLPPTLQPSTPSETGSENSATMTPFAGPSE